MKAEYFCLYSFLEFAWRTHAGHNSSESKGKRVFRTSRRTNRSMWTSLQSLLVHPLRTRCHPDPCILKDVGGIEISFNAGSEQGTQASTPQTKTTVLKVKGEVEYNTTVHYNQPLTSSLGTVFIHNGHHYRTARRNIYIYIVYR